MVELACPRCRVPAEAGDRFCAVCGGSLVNAGTCAGCGHTPPPGANFCPACGTPVASRETATGDVAAALLGSYGSFGRRVAASLIDLVCVGLVWFATAAALVALAAATGGASKRAQAGWGGALLLALAIATAALYIWSESSGWQATPGKRAVGLQVARDDGGRITPGLATGRFFARLLSLITLGGGYLWMLAERERLAIHDAMTDTVVRRRIRPGPAWPPPPA